MRSASVLVTGGFDVSFSRVELTQALEVGDAVHDPTPTDAHLISRVVALYGRSLFGCNSSTERRDHLLLCEMAPVESMVRPPSRGGPE